MAIYVLFEGIDGECKVKGLTNFSEVESFEIGAEKSVEGVTGQSRRRGDVKLGDVTITKLLDSTAPSMFLVTAKSHVFPRVYVVFTESFTNQVKENPYGGTKNVFMEIVLEDVIISNYSVSASGDDCPTETAILNYTRITYRYKLVDKSGAVDTSIVSRAAQGIQANGGMLVGGWDSELSHPYSSAFTRMN